MGVKEWVRNTLERSWAGVGEDAEEILNTDTVTEFFRGLLCPVDEEAVCCIPPPFLNGQERSPEDWEDFLRTVVSELFDAWAKYTSPNPANAKKRKKADEVKEEAEDMVEEEVEEPFEEEDM